MKGFLAKCLKMIEHLGNKTLSIEYKNFLQNYPYSISVDIQKQEIFSKLQELKTRTEINS